MGAGAIEKGSEGPKEAKAEEDKLERSMESGDEVNNLERLLVIQGWYVDKPIKWVI